jgi:hypothetical protein
MKRWVWLALLVAACSAPQASSSSSPITHSPTPSTSICRLPVIGGSSQTPGFLSIPGLTFSPASDAGHIRFYDRQLARWVPWGPPALAGDGLSYAFVDGDNKSSRLHLVDLRTSGDVVLAQGGPWRVVGVQPDAVYVMLIEYLPESPAYGVIAAGRGLWKAPIKGGAPVRLTSDEREWVVEGGAAWGGGSTVNVAGGPNDIVRLDLRTNQLTTWFAPGKRSHLLAVDSGGAPLIMSEAADQELWRVPAPDGGVQIWAAPIDGPKPSYPVVVDGAVVWFSSANLAPTWSIFRYSWPRGLELVANFTDYPVSVAGPCA